MSRTANNTHPQRLYAVRHIDADGVWRWCTNCDWHTIMVYDDRDTATAWAESWADRERVPHEVVELIVSELGVVSGVGFPA